MPRLVCNFFFRPYFNDYLYQQVFREPKRTAQFGPGVSFFGIDGTRNSQVCPASALPGNLCFYMGVVHDPALFIAIHYKCNYYNLYVDRHNTWRKKTDLQTGKTLKIDLPKSNVLQFITEDGSKISARPSGTEPKIKFYFSVNTKLESVEKFDEARDKAKGKIKQIISDMKLWEREAFSC